MNTKATPQLNPWLPLAGILAFPIVYDLFKRSSERKERQQELLDRYRWEDDGGPVFAPEEESLGAEGFQLVPERRGHVVHFRVESDELLLLRELVKTLRSERRFQSALPLLTEYESRFGYLLGDDHG